MNLDKLLVDILKKESKSLADKDRIAVTDNLLIKKVAFDFYKVDNDPYNGFWVAEQSADDGKTYLVRASDPKFDYKSSGEWSAISDYNNENITLSYKSVPIARLSHSEYSFNKDNIFTFKDALLEKVSDDSTFLNQILLSQPEDKVSAIYQSFPELNKKEG